MELSAQQIKDNQKRIEELLLSTGREGICKVLSYLDTSGFFTAPSSRHHHHNRRGGLAQHSLGVCEAALSDMSSLSRESVIICALLHDVYKAARLYYDAEGNIRHNHSHGHGSRSIKILDKCGLKLSEDEKLAIRWHTGGHNASDKDKDMVAKARKLKLWKVVHNAGRRNASEDN